jgi:hypothetical protein
MTPNCTQKINGKKSLPAFLLKRITVKFIVNTLDKIILTKHVIVNYILVYCLIMRDYTGDMLY